MMAVRHSPVTWSILLTVNNCCRQVWHKRCRDWLKAP